MLTMMTYPSYCCAAK